MTLEGDLDAIFNKETDSPLFEDASNFGYIHAPSLNHAVTAAVLRNGYLSNATPQNPESLSINLTSERVRLAMNVIQGMRNGQSLSALLGYYLERGLHDQADLFLDSLIFELRKQFPLAGNRLKPTRDTNVSIEAVEARNVVDGLALVEHVQQLPEEDQTYPFGLEDKLPSLTDPLAVAAVNKEVDKIRNINDAVADLAMAEGVYQVAQGNYDRAAGTLDAYSKAHFPPIPEVVQTPRSGVTLTHRVAIHLQGGLDPSDPVHTTPRSKAEPAVNAWLADELPPMDSLFCVAEFFNHTADEMQTPEVTAADLELQAVDLLYMLDTDGEQQMRALEDQLLLHVLKVPGVRADAEVKIHYRAKRPGKISFFEIEPYLSNLRALLLRSRELKSTDARLPNEAAAAEDDTASIRVEKVELVRDMLDTLNDDLGNLVTQFGSLLDLPDEDDVTQNAIDEIDNLIGAYSETAGGMGLFGLPNTGVSFAYDWRRRQFSSLVGKLSTLIESWDAKVADFEQRLLDYSALPASTSDTKKMTLLLQAAMLITTEAVMPPASQDPNDLLDTLNADLKPPFEAALQEMISIRDTEMELSSLYKRLADMTASITKHDTEPFDVSDNQQAIVTFAKSLQSKTDKLSTEITHHLADVDALIAGDPETDSTGRIEELRSAAKKMLGEDFVILPEFSLTADHEAEWLAAYNDQSALMTYLKTDLSVDFPEDDWLYGVARVREKMHHFESAVIFSEAFGGAALKLTPLQFPRRENDLWLGLDIPEKIPGTEDSWVIEEDKLLYTAHYSVDFNSSSGLHCGVLLDEWTEVIPTKDETTGLAFHYDRPNSEPAQTMLLALPADFTGSWKWQDLVDAMHETLDLARKRAVEPQHLDNTSYSRFLPAVVSSVTRFPIALALDFAFNNAVQFQSEVD